MLNELFIIERGVREAGIEIVEDHPDIKDARRMPTLVVRLNSDGSVSSIWPLPESVTPWTLRDGQHNSFPFVQTKPPLWNVPSLIEEPDAWNKEWAKKSTVQRREALIGFMQNATFNTEAFHNWPGTGLRNRLQERRQELAALDHKAAVVPDTIERFLQASREESGVFLLGAVTEKLVHGVRESAQNSWLEVAVGLLLGKFDAKENQWRCSAALLFEAEGSQQPIYDPNTRAGVSMALQQPEHDSHDSDEDHDFGTCALSGSSDGPLLSGNFPQPNLPFLGQTYLFAKNRDIRANGRYGRFANDAFPISQDVAIRLAAGVKALTTDERKGVTWRAIPGEAPKQRDLLLAFVEHVPDAPVAGTLADDMTEEDFSEEESQPAEDDNADSVAAYEKRTKRLVEAVKAKVGPNFRQTPVRLVVLRKVDPANRKVVYGGAPTVGDLYDAVQDWGEGERNVPPQLQLPLFRKGEKKPRPTSPPNVAPLGLIAFSKQIFLRNGEPPPGKKKEQVGLPAGEALGLFLDKIAQHGGSARRRVNRVLRLVITRRASLLINVAHVQHTPKCWDRRKEALKKLDNREALGSITVLGVLLNKLGRRKEDYMKDTAFKLGQLLAAADVVHAGYCADVRGGDIPPSLLGNQVFTMAQTTPAKALAMLCRKWKPYDGWAKKTSRDRGRIDGLVTSSKKTDQQRGWDIRMALRHVREIKPLAEELASALTTCKCDDVFRAELLLGYITGLPKAQKAPEGNDEEVTQTENQEDKP